MLVFSAGSIFGQLNHEKSVERRLNDTTEYRIKGKFSKDSASVKIYASVKVSPDGIGTFLKLLPGSLSTDSSQIEFVKQCLRKMKFSKAAGESIVTVAFIFTIEEYK